MESAGNNKRIAKNTALLYARMLLIMCIQLYTSRVILVELGVVDYGLYGVIGGVVLIFTFLNGALGASSSRFITTELGKGDLEQLKKVFSTSVAMHLTMAVIILVLCEVIGLWFLNFKMIIPADRVIAANWVFQFSIMTTLFSIILVPYNASIIAHEHMAIFAYMGLFDAFAKMAIAFLIDYNPFDKLIWYASLLMFVQLLVMLIYRFYCTTYFEETRFSLQNDKKLYKSMLSYSMYDLIGSSSVMAQGQGLNMVLNVFCGPVINAARTIAYQVQGAISQFASNFMTAVTPQIIKLYAQGNIEDMMKLVRRSSIFCFVLMFMIVLPISLEINYVLSLWLGDFPPYTASFTILILINSTIDSFRRPRINCFHASGNIKLSNIVTGSILCMALPLGYVFMKIGFDPIWVFFGVIITSCCADCSNLFILKRYIDYSITEFLKRVHLRCLVHALITAIIPVAIHILMPESFLRLVLVSTAAVLCSLASGALIAFDKEDRNRIIGIINKKIKK